METYRYSFGVNHLHLLEKRKKTLESHGYVCEVEIRKIAGFTIHSLIATPPPCASRKERGLL